MECSPGVEHSKTLYLTIEKQILRDIAEQIHDQVTFLSKQQPILNLIPVKLSIASLHGLAKTLERLCE